MHAAQKPGSKLKYVTLDKESNMSTLWQQEEFLRICSEEDLAEKAQAIEMIIPVKKSQVARYNFDPASFFVNRFWGRRPDGVAINEALQIVYTLEFNRSRQGRGVLRGERNRSKSAAQKHHQWVQRSCSEVGI